MTEYLSMIPEGIFETMFLLEFMFYTHIYYLVHIARFYIIFLSKRSLTFPLWMLSLILFFSDIVAMCMLTDNIYDYYIVSQGKTTIPSMDDGEEGQLTDVSVIFS